MTLFLECSGAWKGFFPLCAVLIKPAFRLKFEKALENGPQYGEQRNAEHRDRCLVETIRQSILIPPGQYFSREYRADLRGKAQ